jgi:hypothetical protein
MNYCLTLIQKISIVFILVVSLFLASGQTLFAQSVGVNISYGTRALLSNDIPLDLNLTSPISYSQVKVQWILPYGIQTLHGESTSFTSALSSSSPLLDHLIITPQFPGNYVITANVSGIENDEPFARSSSVYLSVDQNMHLTNNNGAYNVKFAIYIFLVVIALIGFVLLLKGVYNDLIHRFHTWLDKDA